MSYGHLNRLSDAARSSVVEAREVRARPLRLTDVEPGWAVVDLTGHRIGRVTRIADRGLVASRGLGRGQIIVSSDRIAELRDGVVRLTVSRQELT